MVKFARPGAVLFQAPPFGAQFGAQTKNENLEPKNDFLTKPSHWDTKNIIFFKKMSFGLKKPRNRQTTSKNRFFGCSLSVSAKNEVINFNFKICVHLPIFCSDLKNLSKKLKIEPCGAQNVTSFWKKGQI